MNLSIVSSIFEMAPVVKGLPNSSSIASWSWQLKLRLSIGPRKPYESNQQFCKYRNLLEVCLESSVLRGK